MSKIIKTGNLSLVQWQNGACRPATDFEVELWEQHKESVRLLRRLYDLQNGSPLDKYRYAWTVCMDEIEAFLKKNEGKP